MCRHKTLSTLRAVYMTLSSSLCSNSRLWGRRSSCGKGRKRAGKFLVKRLTDRTLFGSRLGRCESSSRTFHACGKFLGHFRVCNVRWEMLLYLCFSNSVVCSHIGSKCLTSGVWQRCIEEGGQLFYSQMDTWEQDSVNDLQPTACSYCKKCYAIKTAEAFCYRTVKTLLMKNNRKKNNLRIVYWMLLDVIPENSNLQNFI